MAMIASVIICTYNRSDYLKRLLDGLLVQSMPKDQYEIIVINDGSTDQTGEICKKFSEGFPNFNYIVNDVNLGKSKSANIGILASQSDRLLFTDDDCIAGLNWIKSMSDLLTIHPIVAGRILTEATNYLTLSRNISEFHPFMKEKSSKNLEFIAGANMGFQKKVFLDIGEFFNTTFAFDMNYILHARKLGYPLFYSPVPFVTHKPIQLSLFQMIKYERRRSFYTIQMRVIFKEILHTPFIMRSSGLLLISTPVIAFTKTAQIFLLNLTLLKYIYTAPIVFLFKMAWCWGAYQGLRSLSK
jgi:glycosyltransferase involved in cell wall biosynthesis